MKLFLSTAAAGALMAASVACADTITFWTPEEQPERLAIQEEMAAAFTAKTGHTVEVVPVTEKDLGTRVTAALCSRKMPVNQRPFGRVFKRAKVI